uniref:(northern house mosquito) hypothetical protein n=1 Tax=Culex pipiens TaxID=7175 RepID=A0A8D8DGT0_CULPI
MSYIGIVHLTFTVGVRNLLVDAVTLRGERLLVRQSQLERAHLVGVQQDATVHGLEGARFEHIVGSVLESVQFDDQTTLAAVLDESLGVFPGLVGQRTVQLLEAGTVQLVLVEDVREQQEVERFLQLLVGEDLQIAFGVGHRREEGVAVGGVGFAAVVSLSKANASH